MNVPATPATAASRNSSGHRSPSTELMPPAAPATRNTGAPTPTNWPANSTARRRSAAALQHAEPDAAPVCVVAGRALLRLLRARLPQWYSRHHESEERADHVLRAAGHRLLEGVRQPARIVLVLHRHGRRIVFEAGRQHLFPRR